jgi:6-phosphofructokinase 1
VVARVDPTSPDPVRLGGIGERVSNEIAKRTGCDCRTTVLGHVVRGGTPVATDRVLAMRFGHQAIETLLSGGAGRMIVAQEGRLHDVDLLEIADRQRLVPTSAPLIAMARAVGTCFGD